MAMITVIENQQALHLQIHEAKPLSQHLSVWFISLQNIYLCNDLLVFFFTTQVLWEGSGWKPVALVDIIETSSVKRIYQKALLQLHPDKLQQRGASTEQKYIAEKVFSILQVNMNFFFALNSTQDFRDIPFKKLWNVGSNIA